MIIDMSEFSGNYTDTLRREEEEKRRVGEAKSNRQREKETRNQDEMSWRLQEYVKGLAGYQ